jgi:hypothetical protein
MEIKEPILHGNYYHIYNRGNNGIDYFLKARITIISFGSMINIKSHLSCSFTQIPNIFMLESRIPD